MTGYDVPVPARELAPGDVVVLVAGDTRQVRAATPVGDGSLVGVDWGDGRHSLLDSWRAVWRLHPPPTPDPESRTGVLDSDATPDSPTSPHLESQ